MTKQLVRVSRIVNGEWAGTYSLMRAVRKGGPTGLTAFIEYRKRPLKLNAAKELVAEIRATARKVADDRAGTAACLRQAGAERNAHAAYTAVRRARALCECLPTRA